MGWALTPYSLPPLVAALISAVLVAVAWSHRDREIARPFLALVVAVGAWSAAYAIQLGFADLGDQLRWWRIGITVGGAIPTFWLLLTIEYAGLADRLTPRLMAALALDPVVFAALVWTDGSHGWIVADATLARSPTVAELAFGPGYLAHIAYAYLLVVAGVLMILWVLVRTTHIYRKQAGMLVVGAVVPLGANVAFTLGLSPLPSVDLTTFAFTVTGTVFATALFRFEFLDLSPVAKEHMIAELGDGLLVLDADGVVVERNANATRILDPAPAVGEPADGVLPGDGLDDADGRVISTPVDGAERDYQVRTAPVVDFQDQVAGHIVALRDVTDREAYEQRLEVANRLLRHNLRNEMNLVLGLAGDLEAELAGDAAEAAATIRETAERVVDIGVKAEGIEATLEAERSTDVRVDLVATAETVAERFRRRDATATIDLCGPDEAWVSVVDDDLVETAVSNLVENAIEHNDRTPRVELRIEHTADGAVPGDADTDGGRVRLSVADNGPAIPEMEYEVLDAGRETALEHGSGVGLWLVHWVVTASGGRTAFDENEPRGNVVTIELPAVEPPRTAIPAGRIGDDAGHG